MYLPRIDVVHFIIQINSNSNTRVKLYTKASLGTVLSKETIIYHWFQLEYYPPPMSHPTSKVGTHPSSH